MEKQAKQSPEWDNKIHLADLLNQAIFFILCKEEELVKVVHLKKIANGFEVYHYTGLSHDRYGVTYHSDGSIRADYVAELLGGSKIELTNDSAVALRHIWECMECETLSAFA